MTLIKRYSSPRIVIELRKFRDGYHVIEKWWDRELGDYAEEFRHSKIKGLDVASNLMAERLYDAEARGYRNFKIYMKSV